MAIRKMNNVHNTYLGEVATSIKEAKTLKGTYYGDLITPSIYVPAITQIAQGIYDELKDKNKVPHVSSDEGGELHFSENCVIPPHMVTRHGALLHELPVLGLCIIILARAKVNAKQQCTDRKKVIKRVADAEAGALGQNKASISKMVQMAIRNQLKSCKGSKTKASTVGRNSNKKGKKPAQAGQKKPQKSKPKKQRSKGSGSQQKKPKKSKNQRGSK
ncbi:hypothetical protein PAXINDRAFT_152770 [Paxillus involutus ATCC 200175]|nr:hypothetical protein PAXINDRAFT_152770 [Paxillus involutus ATCC 200175]